MKDTKAWSQKIQGDKNFAKGYKGLTSVKDILKKAKADGYDLKESDITKEDMKALEMVAGGYLSKQGSGGPSAAGGQVNVATELNTEVHSLSQKGTNNVYTGDNAHTESNNVFDFKANQG